MSPNLLSTEKFKPHYVPTLDGLRGIAAIMVVIYHLWQDGFFAQLPISSNLLRVSIFGQTGVDLFFVLSGFLITRILLSAKESHRYFRNFYGRRALRIFPLYYFILIVTYFIIPILSKTEITPFSEQAWYWFYLQNIPHTLNELTIYWQNIPYTFIELKASGPIHFWSLAVEEHFYLIWPFLIYLIPNRRLLILCFSTVAIAIFSRLIFLSLGVAIGQFWTFTLCRVDAIAIGAMLAVAEPLFRANKSHIRTLAWCTISMGIALLIAWPLFSKSGSIWVSLFRYTVLACFYGGLVGTVAFLKSFPGRSFFESPGLVLCGTISYGIYVYHPFCLKFSHDFLSNQNMNLQALVGFFSSLVIAYISFHIFEKPFLRLKKFFE